ncbi:hypothetical protein BDF21DRAFT_407484 [Thamnidium elegans]|uniref:Secreted protein n=1 Tax=Thamnidium elegans TaxID=101142 RepID=A0A8H7SQQ6_9FUNG|nr:hypothetical protein INT48_005210 [Thamnidium elegans]KAI8096112.1 hypothetical protein BDF21DRAFT_407484 [Thamnidium elegans]
MKLSLLFTSLSAFFYIASAADIEKGGFSLVKRDHGLPYATLPSTACAKPAACSNIATPVTCRCSDIVTTCQNTAGQFCWGSQTLNSTTCPTMPSSCAESSFGTRTASCLCNSQNILCVDNANNYCYGSVTGNTVNVAPIPNAAPGSSPSGASSAAPPAAESTGIPTMSVIGAPSNTNANTPTVSSGSDKLVTKSILTFGCALVAYIAIH